MKLTKSQLKEMIREELKEANSPDNKLYWALDKSANNIAKAVKKYDKKADVQKALDTFMNFLSVQLKRMGYKI